MATRSNCLELTQAIEQKLGRAGVPERNAPRVIDVDLLYFGDRIIDTEALVLPHPRIGERRFVLQPLAGIRPDLVLPGQTRDIARMLDGLISPRTSSNRGRILTSMAPWIRKRTHPTFPCRWR